MADTTQPPMNGTYPAYHDSYLSHAPFNSTTSFQPTQSSTPTNAAPEHKTDVSKDEVGWAFVEQFYTTMSRSPDKLHLFYSRQSHFVFGTEAESVPVVFGQDAINEKIKQLDFQECKVRVLNVDSQNSFGNILITVIGEISNKSESSRKFVQTFVLAEQPNGYYVLNDIFRYLVDDEDDLVNEQAAVPAPEEQPAEAPTKPVPETAPALETQVNDEAAATKVDEKLERAEANGEVPEEKEPAPQANGAAQEEPKAASVAAAETEAPAVDKERILSPKPTPASPEKTPPSPVKETAAPGPAVPKTWANIASKTGAAAAVVPAVPVAPPKQAAASSASQPAPAVTPAPRENTPGSSTDGSGWQTAGHEHKKTQSRAGEEQNVLAYIKNVNDKVDASLLKQTLSRFGKLKYFDVSRPKNCAFVEFAEPAGYAAAVAANPHQIGTEQISVEERRTRANAYGGGNFGPRGGAGRGRGDRAGSQGRGGFPRDGGRGGFGMRGRGGNAGPKGRSQAQAA